MCIHLLYTEKWRENTRWYVFFSIKTGWKVLWQKLPHCEKQCAYFLYSKFCVNHFSTSLFCWSHVLTWLRPKWWRYLHCKCHLGANDRCGKMSPALHLIVWFRGYTVPAIHLLLLYKLPAGGIWPVPQYSKGCTLGVSYSDSAVWVWPKSPQKWARTRGGA